MNFELAIGDWSKHKARIYQVLKADSLKDICEAIMELPASETKHELYFLRGNAVYRNNESMLDIQFLVIDGDSGLIMDKKEKNVIGVNNNQAPDPVDVGVILREHGINHIIYPSWSNGQKIPKEERIKGWGKRKVKWRLMVPCYRIDSAEELRDHTAMLHRLLQDNGIWINPVVESFVLSQAWYLSKPIGSKYHGKMEYHFYDEGIGWDGEKLVSFDGFSKYFFTQRAHYPKKANNRRGIGDKISFTEALTNLSTGSQLHPSMRVITAEWLREGKSPKKIKKRLIALTRESRSPERLRNISQEIDEIISWLRR